MGVWEYTVDIQINNDGEYHLVVGGSISQSMIMRMHTQGKSGWQYSVLRTKYGPFLDGWWIQKGWMTNNNC